LYKSYFGDMTYFAAVVMTNALCRLQRATGMKLICLDNQRMYAVV